MSTQLDAHDPSRRTQGGLFDCVSPLDFRYYGPEKGLVALLSPYVTERARIEYEKRVEIALIRVLARRGICPREVRAQVEEACAATGAEEVAEEEGRIGHNIRALVNRIRAKMPEASRPYVHLTLTSFDVIDTALALCFRECAEQAIVPRLLALEHVLIELAEREAETLQIGRTHGQHAVPITFGFAMAGYVARLGELIEAIGAAASNLRGKISGAVGAYNASSLFVSDPEEFEREVLAELGLKPGTHSTQIVAPEFITDFFHSLISCFSVLADLADDLRHLQRTEIDEVREAFSAEQVGSSTMPQKRNPVNFENVKSMYKAFMPRMVTVYSDQLSEHQRDLTNSATNRFLPEIIVGLVASAQRMSRSLSRLVVNREKMIENARMTGGLTHAEPLYLLLSALGHPDAHEAIRRLTLEAEQTVGAQGLAPLLDLARKSPDLASYVDRMTPEQLAVFSDPLAYAGIAAEKARSVCAYWRQRLGIEDQ